MAFYVTYRASKKDKNRSQIARRLHALGCEHIRRAFWKVDESTIRTVTNVLSTTCLVILKRRREMERPRFTHNDVGRELGSLVVIAYRVPTPKDSNKIEQLLKRTPCIRLTRGAYAFTHWHKRFDPNHELVDAGTFWNHIHEVDDKAIAVPRLNIVNPAHADNLVKETANRVEREINAIIEGYRSLHSKMNEREYDRPYVLGTVRRLRKRFVTLRKKTAFYDRWLQMNLTRLANKPYPTIKKVHSILEEKYGVVISPGKVQLTTSVF